jgi:hypothetical protein
MKKNKNILIMIAAIIIGYGFLNGSIVGNAIGFIGVIGLIIEIVKLLKNKKTDTEQPTQ